MKFDLKTGLILAGVGIGAWFLLGKPTSIEEAEAHISGLVSGTSHANYSHGGGFHGGGGYHGGYHGGFGRGFARYGYYPGLGVSPYPYPVPGIPAYTPGEPINPYAVPAPFYGYGRPHFGHRGFFRHRF